MKPSLQLKLHQQLNMTPQLQQAIRFLQLSALDLRNEIQTFLESNPLLEITETPKEDVSTEENSEGEPHLADDVDPLSWEQRMMGSRRDKTYTDNGNDVETLNSAPASLRDHLVWQMQLTTFSDKDRIIAANLIDSINEDGFLTTSLDDITAGLKSTLEMDVGEVEVVLHRIQQFEPLGIGARDLSECLCIQLENLPDIPWRNQALRIVRQHMDLLAKRDYLTLKRRLSVTMDELSAIIQTIKSLNPRPGSGIGGANTQFITPDVIARKKNGIWTVELNPDCTPALHINQEYATLVRRQDTSADNQFLRTQLQEARWFLKSIENRNETLYKVASCIAKKQQAFLECGAEGMKPLILHDIAEEIGMHESTVSRITSQKYLYTPRGTFELKYFFSGGVNTDEGDVCSATAIRALLKKLICNENPRKPLSDSKLAKLLAEQGIPVARRTVAKYREAMAVPPSNERKQLI